MSFVHDGRRHFGYLFRQPRAEAFDWYLNQSCDDPGNASIKRVDPVQVRADRALVHAQGVSDLALAQTFSSGPASVIGVDGVLERCALRPFPIFEGAFFHLRSLFPAPIVYPSPSALTKSSPAAILVPRQNTGVLNDAPNHPQ